MTFHNHRQPRPAAEPAAVQLGPVTLALRAMRSELTQPVAVGPVTAAIRTMRAAVSDFDDDADVLALRRALGDRIEADLALLDMLGGDPDLEQDAGEMPEIDAGDEPEGAPYGMHDATEDDEPSLGAPEPVAAAFAVMGPDGQPFFPGDQARWAAGSVDDREAENEHGTDEDRGELSLGWPANVRQLALGQNTEDGDATALERHGAGFVRSGHEDAEDSHDREHDEAECGVGDADGAWEQVHRFLAHGGDANRAARCL